MLHKQKTIIIRCNHWMKSLDEKHSKYTGNITHEYIIVS